MNSLAGVSLMLRLLWACLRWDDMAVKPSASGTTRTGNLQFVVLNILYHHHPYVENNFFGIQVE